MRVQIVLAFMRVWLGGAARLTECVRVRVQIVLAFTRGWAPDAALALANAVGGATATRPGAGRHVADWRAVQALLRRGAASADDRLAVASQQALARLDEPRDLGDPEP